MSDTTAMTINYDDAIDKWLSENLQDEDSVWDLAINRNRAIYHSGGQFATPLSDHEVDVKGKNHISQSIHSARHKLLCSYLGTVE